ncbi:MAG: M20/M25/M40 family metallo-hydrolase, partial [Thermoanaerobaculia bacterium]
MFFASVVIASSLNADVAKVERRYDKVESKQLVPMLTEVIQFPTYEKNEQALRDQKAWLIRKASDLGFIARDSGKITEIELPATDPSAPVLGLIVHGDVQPVNADAWSFPPFSGRVDRGYVLGRGSADDKGPLAQALTAMKALKESRVHRTHTIRLLVGSTEESDGTEMGEYLKDHKAPDYSLVLDSEFPVVVGEKAWDLLVVSTPLDERDASTSYSVTALTAGLAPSIVPDRAEVTLRWRSGAADWQPLIDSMKAFAMPEGTRLATTVVGDTLKVAVSGHSAHAGVNLTGGRNALVALSRLMEGRLPRGGADDLLAFARLAGQDLYGTGLGIRGDDPVWGRYAVNVAMIKDRKLSINLRRTPPKTGPQAMAYL